MNITYAVVSAFERSKLHYSKSTSSRVFTVALLVVFFVVLMGGLAAGVSVYRSVAETQLQTNEVRTETGLIASIIRANDVRGAAGVADGPEGRALVFTEHLDSGDFEMRLYLYEGQVVQEYTLAGAPFTPSRAQALLPTNSFDFSLAGRLLSVTTDQGTFDVALRSMKEGGA